MAAKSWQEKLANSKDLPKVVTLTDAAARQWGGKKATQLTMAIPAPRDIDALMKTVKRGQLVTTQELRAAVARQHAADVGCPLTTGIFSWIAAHAAQEEREAGKTRVTPYWRTLKTYGELNPKFPGGLERQAQLLAAEGHTIVTRGKRQFVADYQNSLAPLLPGQSILATARGHSTSRRKKAAAKPVPDRRSATVTRASTGKTPSRKKSVRTANRPSKPAARPRSGE
ncbi:MAG: MGMT family protein [Pirellulales bacterium]|nr:MGMT family protein [Pirellulales bacterium]